MAKKDINGKDLFYSSMGHMEAEVNSLIRGAIIELFDKLPKAQAIIVNNRFDTVMESISSIFPKRDD